MNTWVMDSKLEESSPNGEWLIIHTREPLADMNAHYDGTGTMEVDKFDKAAIDLVSTLEKIKGITKVACRRHRVSIRRSFAYSWDELLDKAAPLFLAMGGK